MKEEAKRLCAEQFDCSGCDSEGDAGIAYPPAVIDVAADGVRRVIEVMWAEYQRGHTPEERITILATIGDYELRLIEAYPY